MLLLDTPFGFRDMRASPNVNALIVNICLFVFTISIFLLISHGDVVALEMDCYFEGGGAFAGFGASVVVEQTLHVE